MMSSCRRLLGKSGREACRLEVLGRRSRGQRQLVVMVRVMVRVMVVPRMY
jgi:flagellar biogenesis protein FliO